MNISILDQNTKYSSPAHLKFVTRASIKELCNRHGTYKGHRKMTIPTVVNSIECSSGILNQLEKLNYVYSYLDTATSWTLYKPTQKGLEYEFGDDNDIKNKPGQVEQGNYVFAEDNSDIDKELSKELSGLKAATPTQIKMIELYTLHRRYTGLISSALSRNIEFTLSIDDLANLLKETHCHYTGKPFEGVCVNRLTIDRIDRNKGYIPGNVVACTDFANQMKNNFLERDTRLFESIDDLKSFVDKIYYSIHTDLDPLEKLLIK